MKEGIGEQMNSGAGQIATGNLEIIQPQNERENLSVSKIFNDLSSCFDQISTISNSLIHNKSLSKKEFNEQINSLKDLSERAFHTAEDFLTWKTIKRNGNNNELSEEDKLISSSMHDLKARFNAILGFSNLIYENEYSDVDNEEYLKPIISATKGAHKIVEHFWSNWGGENLTKIELKLSNFELASYTKNLIGRLPNEAGLKKITINNEIKDGIYITADRFVLQSILENLITNAIKFTHNGGEISISGEKEGNLIKISVKDNGVGIEKDRLPNVFNSLGTTTASTEGKYGTGFGLYICKDLVEKMNGSISVESEEDNGSTFIVTLPAGNQN